MMLMMSMVIMQRCTSSQGTATSYTKPILRMTLIAALRWCGTATVPHCLHQLDVDCCTADDDAMDSTYCAPHTPIDSCQLFSHASRMFYTLPLISGQIDRGATLVQEMHSMLMLSCSRGCDGCYAAMPCRRQWCKIAMCCPESHCFGCCRCPYLVMLPPGMPPGI